MWLWLLFPAVTMSLGWGLRGYIGGGPLGAMIPGAMFGLALCLLLEREADSGLVAAFAAIGVGFGGQMTYGQTVGLALLPETRAWAMTGFALKGAIWGLLAGAVIGIALTRARYSRKDLVAGFGLMALGVLTGWKFINEPKLIYFSNRYDKPRPELWAGLLLGAMLLLVWLTWRSGARLPWRFALWGALGGGAGFASGAGIQVWGRHNMPDFPIGWWKVMEFTFGACLGLAYGYCAWRHRGEIAKQEARLLKPARLGQAAVSAAVALTLGLLVYRNLSTRFDYTLVGAVLLSLALYSEPLAWQIAITLTSCAFAIDFQRNRPEFPAAALWMFVIMTTLAVFIAVTRHPRMRPMFVLMTVWAVVVALLKGLLPPAKVDIQLVTTELVFVLFALSAVLWTRGWLSSKPADPSFGS